MSGPAGDARTPPPTPAAATSSFHLGHWAGEHPDRPAVIMTGSGEVTTYRQLDERSNRLAHVLRRSGLRTGDHLALMMENSSALLEVAWAAQRAGLYYTALNSHLRRDEVQHILDDCGAEAFFVSGALGAVARALDLGRIRLRVSVGGEVPGFEPFDQVLARGEATQIADEAEGREMLYSSGTTGVPKGVRKQLTGGPPGDPESASVIIARNIGSRGID
ncbi:MAG TPA: AMP-binding protein, partial [Acidimicrobiales bacterium]